MQNKNPSLTSACNRVFHQERTPRSITHLVVFLYLLFPAVVFAQDQASSTDNDQQDDLKTDLPESRTNREDEVPRYRPMPARAEAPKEIRNRETDSSDPFLEYPEYMEPSQVRKNPAELPAESALLTNNWTSIEIVLSVAVLAFGLIVFSIQSALMYKTKSLWTPKSMLRTQALTLIIVGSLTLIVAGYSNTQIAPVIGLLATMAGYLLKSNDKPDNSAAK